MDPGGSSAGVGLGVKKQEDLDGSDPKSGQKSEQKPVVRTLNRVPRKWPFLSPVRLSRTVFTVIIQVHV